MNTKTYFGRIRIKSGGFPIVVSIGATSNQAAKRAIEAQYGTQFKKWDRQMSTQNC